MQDKSQSWFWEGMFIAIIFLGGTSVILWGLYEYGRSDGRFETYRAFRDGRAQVIEYTVPGSGKCRAVLIDGKRQAEACK